MQYLGQNYTMSLLFIWISKLTELSAFYLATLRLSPGHYVLLFIPNLSNLPSQENCSIERAIAVNVKESSEKSTLVEYPKISNGFLNLCSRAGSCLKNRKMASRGTIEQLQDSTFMVEIKSQDKELKFRLRDYLCHIRKKI